MQKKLMPVLALLCFLMASFSGCTQTENSSVNLIAEISSSQATQENVEASTEEDTQSVPQTVQKVLSSEVVVNARVTVPSDGVEGSLPRYQASLRRFTAENVKNVLLEGATIVQETEMETKDSAFQDAVRHTYITSDGQTLSVGEENIFYNTSTWNDEDLSYFDPLPTSQSYNGDAFQTGKELDFAKPEECFDQLKAVLQNLGIAVADMYECYTLDSETLTNEAEKFRAAPHNC